MDKKKTICLDFDGVIHSYLAGWKGETEIPDMPNTGAFEWIAAATERFDVCVFSSRSRSHDGRMAMIDWFKRHGMEAEVLQQIDFPASKPPAWITIDDRCLCFTGDWPAFNWIDEFRPWYLQEYATEGGLGATGQLPDGKVSEDDQGELRMAVGNKNGDVFIDFGKPVTWVSFSPEQAEQLSALIESHSKDALEDIAENG